MTADIERLDAKDLGAAVPLLVAEGWTFAREDLERLDRLGGAIGAREDGRLVGFLTFIDLDPVRWVGNVAVSPKARGQGLGTRLVEAAIAAPGRCPTVGLYSVEKAVPLYARLGFAPQGEAYALRADAAKPKGKARGVETMQDTDLPDVFRIDRAATRMDRRALLGELFQEYPDTSLVAVEGDQVVGYAFAKTYADVTELGPVVAHTPRHANALFDALLEATRVPHEAAVLGANGAALSALEARGFHRAFRTVPMFRGAAPTWDVAALATAAGLEKS